MHTIETKILLDKESPLLSGNTDALKRNLQLEIDNEFETYIISCGKALVAITSSLSKARLSLQLLDTKSLESYNLDNQFKSTFIEMLIENTIIRVQSIYDRVLILINKILNLGISNDSIGHNQLVTNAHVKKFNLEEKLKSINKACNEYRLARNTIIHHDRYSEDQLDRLTLIIKADQLARENQQNGIISSEELRELTEDVLGTKREELSKYLDKIEQKLFELYDSILPIYDYQKNKLRPY
jgi:hypothetical protein